MRLGKSCRSRGELSDYASMNIAKIGVGIAENRYSIHPSIPFQCLHASVLARCEESCCCSWSQFFLLLSRLPDQKAISSYDLQPRENVVSQTRQWDAWFSLDYAYVELAEIREPPRTIILCWSLFFAEFRVIWIISMKISRKFNFTICFHELSKSNLELWKSANFFKNHGTSRRKNIFLEDT